MEKFKLTVCPRFNETDALGHINNSVLINWAEEARNPIFMIFTPDLDPKNWELILARNEVDYLKQVFHTSEVEIETYLSKIGNSSMTLEHEFFQSGQKVAHCKSILINFDYKTQKSIRISDGKREILKKYLST